MPASPGGAGPSRGGSLYILSAMAIYTVEEVRELAPGPMWFQLYTWRDRGLVREVVERAQASGYGALVVTIDVPLAARRIVTRATASACLRA